MSLRILSQPPPDPERVAAELVRRIEAALPGARARVTAESPGHFSVEVVAEAFAGQPSVRRQQAVYAAIRELMAGDDAPVHAVDRMVTRTP
jgi:acid stress-induced BolA-like protein IbaG/YrbA